MAATLGVSFLLLNLIIHTAAGTAATDFIKSSCRTTRYPSLCVQSLSRYASVIRQSQRRLTLTALSVSVSKTRSCASFVNNLRSSRRDGAVRDCIENMGDSVDRLSQSVRELVRAGSREDDFGWHVSNVQTWVSAALTDQNTCLDGFDDDGGGAKRRRPVDPKIKGAIRRRVVKAAQVTSNALALINRFASSHREAP